MRRHNTDQSIHRMRILRPTTMAAAGRRSVAFRVFLFRGFRGLPRFRDSATHQCRDDAE
jgi:hypothetical protein